MGIPTEMYTLPAKADPLCPVAISNGKQDQSTMKVFATNLGLTLILFFASAIPSLESLQFLNLSPMVGSALKSKQVRAKEMKYD